MICPQTKAECQYNCDYLMQRQCSAPPPPTLAEIERLVDEHGAKREAYGDYRVDKDCWDDYESEREAIRSARAALMAAIQRHIQKT